MGELVKLVIKLYVDKTQSCEWKHLCYIPKDLFDSYKENMPEEFSSLNQTISRWVREDFNKDLTISSQAELDILKEYIRGYYKEAYADVYLDQSTDRQGWMRVWVSKKMKEDLESNGK